LTECLKAIRVAGQTAMMKAVRVNESDVCGFVTRIARPEDEVWVETTVVEKTDTHLWQVT